MKLRVALAVTWILAGCGDERAPFHKPTANGGASDAGASDTSASADGSQTPRPTPDGGAGGGGPSLDCRTVSPAAVHLFAAMGNVNELGFSAGSLLPSLSIQECPSLGTAFIARVHPVDHGILYVGHDFGSGATRRVLKRFEYGLDPDNVDDPIVPTVVCEDSGGISTFHYDPRTQGIIANCHLNETQCEARELEKVVGLAGNWEPCAQGPYYDAAGELVYEGDIVAINGDGLQLTDARRTIYSVAVYDPESEESTALTSDIQEPEDQRNNTRLAVRGRDNGFWLVLGSVGSKMRRLYFVAPDGTVTLEGRYADAEGIPWDYALDAEGRLYEDLGLRIRRSAPDGTTVDIVYDAEDPSHDDEEAPHGGISGLLLSAPY